MRALARRSTIFPRQQILTLETVLDALVEDELVANKEAQWVRNFAAGQGKITIHPLVMVANQRLADPRTPDAQLSLEALTRWLAARSGFEYLKIDPTIVDVDQATGIVSHGYAKQNRILPLELTERSAIFATSEPFLDSWIAEISHVLRRDVRVFVANPLDVHRYQLEFFRLSRSVREAAADKLRADSDKVLNFEQLLELGEVGAEDQHVVRIVDWLLQYAFEQRASDIHLEPRRERGHVRFRIDGALHRVYQLPTPVMLAVVSRIKILGRMDVSEKRRPQDGRIKTRSPAGREVELRLSTMATAFGEKCVLRIFDPEVASRSFSELGFSSREIELWKSMVERPHGIVLVTGPTGSGKTTTLYTTLRHLAKPELNLCTVEDPIEMVWPELNQMQVQPAIGVDFAQGVRTLLRQDPDIIMVGEVRDLETANMAIQASLTGHLVLSTLHTNDAPSAITRLLDLGVPYYLLRTTLAGIVAQRLVRLLCPHCKKNEPLDERRWKALLAPWSMPMPEHGAVPGGCDECRNTGFLGRTSIYEMLLISPETQRAITGDTDHQGLSALAYRSGMRPLRVAGARKVAQQLTSLNEVYRVVPPPPEPVSRPSRSSR